jgi:hypothetical protein
MKASLKAEICCDFFSAALITELVVGLQIKQQIMLEIYDQ